MNRDLRAILLINLGTPKSTAPKDVGTYLNEFLTDSRVIDIPWIQRQLLVRGIIVPRRKYSSAKNYEKVWTDAGSPLLLHSVKLREKLDQSLGPLYHVELAMRYQTPSIKSALDHLNKLGTTKLMVLPLFPQYASATTGSVHQEVMKYLSKWETIPETTFIHSYPDHPQMIETFAANARQFTLENYDHFLFSYHGLPVRHLQKADRQDRCLKQPHCCAQLTPLNRHCYRAQCFATTRALAKKLDLAPDQFSTCFQSRLGKEPWIEPYTEDTLRRLAGEGVKKLLVFSPAFTADCLETLDEIRNEYGELFKELGGESLDLVPSLNSEESWVNALKSIVLEKWGNPENAIPKTHFPIPPPLQAAPSA